VVLRTLVALVLNGRCRVKKDERFQSESNSESSSVERPDDDLLPTAMSQPQFTANKGRQLQHRDPYRYHVQLVTTSAIATQRNSNSGTGARGDGSVERTTQRTIA